MLGQHRRIAGGGKPVGDAFEDGGEIADRDPLGTRWIPEMVICDGTMSLISSPCSLGNSLSSFCTSP